MDWWSDGRLEAKGFQINVSGGVSGMLRTLGQAATGHSGWYIETDCTPLPADDLTKYNEVVNTPLGLWYDPGKISNIAGKLINFVKTGNNGELNWPGVFQLNDTFYVDDKKDYVVDSSKVILLLEFSKSCKGLSLYNMANHNCTDITMEAMKKAGVTPPDCRHTVTFVYRERDNNGVVQTFQQDVEMSLPELLFKEIMK